MDLQIELTGLKPEKKTFANSFRIHGIDVTMFAQIKLPAADEWQVMKPYPSRQTPRHWFQIE